MGFFFSSLVGLLSSVPDPPLPLTPTCPAFGLPNRGRWILELDGSDFQFLNRRLSHDVFYGRRCFKSQLYPIKTMEKKERKKKVQRDHNFLFIYFKTLKKG